MTFITSSAFHSKVTFLRFLPSFIAASASLPMKSSFFQPM